MCERYSITNASQVREELSTKLKDGHYLSRIFTKLNWVLWHPSKKNITYQGNRILRIRVGSHRFCAEIIDNCQVRIYKIALFHKGQAEYYCPEP